jgi:hypothetical protein
MQDVIGGSMLVGKGTMMAAAIIYGIKAARPVWRLRHLPEIERLKLALGYWRAAERDQKNDFPFTAAMEWHKAAELFSPIPKLSDRCWQEWERIVHLPRHLARSSGMVSAASTSLLEVTSN